MERWYDLTARERALVALMGALLLLTLLYLGLMRPVMAYHQDSVRTLETARQSYADIAGGAAEIRAYRAAGAQATGPDNQPVRVVVSQEARAAGVAISRIQPGEDGALTVWVDGVASTALYGWLAGLADHHNLAPVKIHVQKTGSGGLLRVQVQFEGSE